MSKKNQDPILYIRLFLIVVFFAAALSLIYKSILLVKNSSFKYDSFNLLLIDSDARVVHIDVASRKMSILELPMLRAKIAGKQLVEQSAAAGILIDGAITLPSNNSFSRAQFMNLPLAFDLIFASGKYKFDNVNEFDIMKIFFLSKFIPERDRQISAGHEMDLFADQKILAEAPSVQIINATDIDGFGTRISKALSNAGFNVVALDTGKKQASSLIASDVSSISVRRLSRSFKIPIIRSGSQDISDITLILGPDAVSH